MALAAGSWTLTISKQWISGGKKHVTGTLAIPGGGSDTYVDGGIPLPAIGNFGFHTSMDVLQLFGVDATAGTTAEYHTRWDKTNHTLFLYEEEATAAGGPLLECDTSEVPGARTWNFLAIGN
jgi:hypothetical protein